MARRQAEAENHWPGFVDVLSTIVMVVTFLLIILGLVIFVISKSISTQIAASSSELKSMQQKLAQAQSQSPDKQKQDQSQNSPSSQSRQAQKTSTSKTTASASRFRSNFSDELTQSDKVESQDRLLVRSRLTKTTKQITIATTEQETKKRSLQVTSSSAVLSLLFKGGVAISKDVSAQVQNFLKSRPKTDQNAKYEIRAFQNHEGGSISEARRLAYYRAMAARNELLSHGVAADRVAIKVGLSHRSEDVGKVNIYLK